jgi:hypothetical protein
MGTISADNPKTKDLYKKLQNPSSLNIKHPKK